MNVFRFSGNIPASKSELNRALILKSFFPTLSIEGSSDCDDVQSMQKALNDFENGSQEIFCGEAGTVLRFMALRVSRNTGIFRLTGTPRLMERPHEEVKNFLLPLGVEVSIEKNFINIHSTGWKKPLAPIRLTSQTTSQFASGFLLSCWGLDFEMEIKIENGISQSYFKLTEDLLKQIGLQFVPINIETNIYKIPICESNRLTQNFSKHNILKCDLDISSAFSVAAMAALQGNCQILNWNSNSTQPDLHFVSILEKMGIPVKESQTQLEIESFKFQPEKALKTIDVNLNKSPDLFPVLSILCAFAEGKSVLWGAPQLRFKESNRIQKTKELLTKIGVSSLERDDGLEIQGQGNDLLKKISMGPEFEYSSDHDHRMAMAVGILRKLGAKIKLNDPEVISKSFPKFWSHLGFLDWHSSLKIKTAPGEV